MKRQKLGDACSRLSSGKSIRASEINSAGSYPVIGGNGLRGYADHFNFDGECAVIGRQGAACGNIRFHSGKAYITEHAVVAVADECNDSRYLAYLLSTMRLGRLSAQSAQPGLSVKTLSKQEVDLPSLEVQKQVVRVLGALDDKIEANAKLNGYLEELLLAKYDDLFPESGPYDGTLADIGEVVGGATPSKKRPEYYCQDGIGWVTPRDLSNTNDKFLSRGADDITEEGYNSCSAKLMPKGSVLFSSRAPIGYVAIAANEVATNQGFKSVVPNKSIGTAFTYCFLVRNKQRIADMGAGTTFPEVSSKIMKSVKLTIPRPGECKAFSAFANPLLYQQYLLETEGNKLAALRDTLLPKLMSGEIDISKVDLTQLNSHLAEY